MKWLVVLLFCVVAFSCANPAPEREDFEDDVVEDPDDYSDAGHAESEVTESEPAETESEQTESEMTEDVQREEKSLNNGANPAPEREDFEDDVVEDPDDDSDAGHAESEVTESEPAETESEQTDSEMTEDVQREEKSLNNGGSDPVRRKCYHYYKVWRCPVVRTKCSWFACRRWRKCGCYCKMVDRYYNKCSRWLGCSYRRVKVCMLKACPRMTFKYRIASCHWRGIKRICSQKRYKFCG